MARVGGARGARGKAAAASRRSSFITNLHGWGTLSPDTCLLEDERHVMTIAGVRSVAGNRPHFGRSRRPDGAVFPLFFVTVTTMPIKTLPSMRGAVASLPSPRARVVVARSRLARSKPS